MPSSPLASAGQDTPRGRRGSSVMPRGRVLSGEWTHGRRLADLVPPRLRYNQHKRLLPSTPSRWLPCRASQKDFGLRKPFRLGRFPSATDTSRPTAMSNRLAHRSGYVRPSPPRVASYHSSSVGSLFPCTPGGLTKRKCVCSQWLALRIKRQTSGLTLAFTSGYFLATNCAASSTSSGAMVSSNVPSRARYSSSDVQDTDATDSATCRYPRVASCQRR